MNTTPKHKLGIAMQHMVEQGKRPCFRLDGLRITIANEQSANPGYLYIKNDSWDYIGKISPEGLLMVTHPGKITSQQKLLVLEAINEPELTAMSSGRVTGSCCCCGRTLTNPLSIELGIGPICRGFWFPDSLEIPGHVLVATGSLPDTPNTNAMETTLELDLGSPTIPEPVMALVKAYDNLNHTQRMICLSMLEEIESNASN